MRYLPYSNSVRSRVLGVGLAFVLLLFATAPGFADTTADYGIAGGWFFTQTGGGQGQGYTVLDGGSDSSGNLIKFWTEFQRLGGVPTLGYPVGEPYVAVDRFTYQPFQRAVLQWRPELGHALLSNTFEILSTAGRDDWLYVVKGIPRPIPDDGSGGNYQKAVVTRLGWLTNDAIRAFYFANPNPRAIPVWSQDAAIQFYGLPMSLPEQHGPFISQRFQRIAFQFWTANVTGMPVPGTVIGVLGGDLLKEAAQVPASAIQPLGPGGTPLVISTGTPTAPVLTVPVPPPTATATPTWTPTTLVPSPTPTAPVLTVPAPSPSATGTPTWTPIALVPSQTPTAPVLTVPAPPPTLTPVRSPTPTWTPTAPVLPTAVPSP